VNATEDRLGPAQGIVAAITGAVAVVVANLLASAALGVWFASSGQTPGAQALQSLPVLSVGVIVTSLAMIGTAVALPAMLRRPLRTALGLHRAPAVVFLLAPLGIFGLGPVSELMLQLAQRVAPDLTFGVLDTLRGIAKQHPPWALLPLLALLPGLSEELFFRGLIQRAFGNGLRAILVSALFFAGFHLDPHHVAGVLPLGLYLAWLGARSGSTWVPIVAHIANNALAVLAPQVAALDVGHGTERPMPMWFAAAGLLLTGVSTWAIDAVLSRASERRVSPPRQ
jgi:membrane protease YdiL (CAAX protease family)